MRHGEDHPRRRCTDQRGLETEVSPRADVANTAPSFLRRHLSRDVDWISACAEMTEERGREPDRP